MLLALDIGSDLQPAQAHLGGSLHTVFNMSGFRLQTGDCFSCWRYDCQTRYKSSIHNHPQGTPTILLGCLCLYMLPDRPESTPFLTEAERKIAINRMNRGTRGDVGAVIRRSNVHGSNTSYHVLTDAQVTSLRLSRTGGQVSLIPANQLSDVYNRST